MSEIDWSTFDENDYPENNCTCVCGHEFRSHSKYVTAPSPRIVPRKPCPACGESRLRRASSDPESFTIRGRS